MLIFDKNNQTHFIDEGDLSAATKSGSKANLRLKVSGDVIMLGLSDDEFLRLAKAAEEARLKRENSHGG